MFLAIVVAHCIYMQRTSCISNAWFQFIKQLFLLEPRACQLPSIKHNTCNISNQSKIALSCYNLQCTKQKPALNTDIQVESRNSNNMCNNYNSVSVVRRAIISLRKSVVVAITSSIHKRNALALFFVVCKSGHVTLTGSRCYL